jgi:hypothetical protein
MPGGARPGNWCTSVLIKPSIGGQTGNFGQANYGVSNGLWCQLEGQKGFWIWFNQTLTN